MIHGNRPTDCQEYANPLELMNRLSFDSDLCVNVLTFKLVYSNMVTYDINQTTGQNVFASNVKKCCMCCERIVCAFPIFTLFYKFIWKHEPRTE